MNLLKGDFELTPVNNVLLCFDFFFQSGFNFEIDCLGSTLNNYFSTDFFIKHKNYSQRYLNSPKNPKNEKLKIYEDIRYMTASHEYSLPSISHTFSAYILSQFYSEHNFLTNDILRHQFLDEATTFNG